MPPTITPYTYVVNPDGNTVTITGYNGRGGVVVIPDSIGGYRVSAIAPFALSGNSTIRDVTIPKSVRNIGDFAFSNSPNLVEVDIVSTNINIEGQPFIGDSSLTKVTVSGQNQSKYIPPSSPSIQQPNPIFAGNWNQLITPWISLLTPWIQL